MPRGRGSKSLKTRFNLNKLARFHGVQQPDTEFIQFSKRECLRGILPGTITMFVFPFILGTFTSKPRHPGSIRILHLTQLPSFRLAVF